MPDLPPRVTVSRVTVSIDGGKPETVWDEKAAVAIRTFSAQVERLEDQVRRLTAERDEANERIRDLEKSVARLVERANRQRDRIGRAHDLLSGVDADV